MMRLAMLLFILPLLAVATVATVARAQGGNVGVDSDAFVDQVGAGDSGAVTQNGAAVARIAQQGTNQTLHLTQHDGGTGGGTGGTGAGARIDLDMRGLINDAVVTQHGVAVAAVAIAGTGNSLWLAQSGGVAGAANAVALAQSGIGNSATLTQYGSGNAIALRQTRNDNIAAISQTGTNLAITMTQDGGARAIVSQGNR